MMAHRGPDAVDKLVGRNIRVLRLAKGLSQTELADALGVTFQQVQKYEKGTNRVGSGRLLKISGILGVKITDFFEGTDRPHDTARRSVFDQLAQPESFRLVQAFSGIDRPNIRRTLVRLIEQIAAER
jgi:transcriptional regulator with XRE-family HTH domain